MVAGHLSTRSTRFCEILTRVDSFTLTTCHGVPILKEARPIFFPFSFPKSVNF